MSLERSELTSAKDSAASKRDANGALHLEPALSKQALEAISQELGEDQATLVELYKAARDEKELLEFKNYELLFKIQELENKQKNLLSSIGTKTSRDLEPPGEAYDFQFQLDEDEDEDKTTKSPQRDLSSSPSSSLLLLLERNEKGTPTTILPNGKEPKNQNAKSPCGGDGGAPATRTTNPVCSSDHSELQTGAFIGPQLNGQTNANSNYLNNATSESGNNNNKADPRQQALGAGTSLSCIVVAPTSTAPTSCKTVTSHLPPQTKNGIPFARTAYGEQTKPQSNTSKGLSGRAVESLDGAQACKLGSELRAATSCPTSETPETATSAQPSGHSVATDATDFHHGGGHENANELLPELANAASGSQQVARNTNVEAENESDSLSLLVCALVPQLCNDLDASSNQLDVELSETIRQTKLKVCSSSRAPAANGSSSSSSSNNNNNNNQAADGQQRESPMLAVDGPQSNPLRASSGSLARSQPNLATGSRRIGQRARIVMPVQQLRPDPGASASRSKSVANLRGLSHQSHQVIPRPLLATASKQQGSVNGTRPVSVSKKNLTMTASKSQANPMRVRSKSNLDQRALGWQVVGPISALSSGASASHLPLRMSSSLQLRPHQSSSGGGASETAKHATANTQTQQVPTTPANESRHPLDDGQVSNSKQQQKLSLTVRSRPARNYKSPLANHQQQAAGRFVTSQIPTLIEQSHAPGSGSASNGSTKLKRLITARRVVGATGNEFGTSKSKSLSNLSAASIGRSTSNLLHDEEPNDVQTERQEIELMSSCHLESGDSSYHAKSPQAGGDLSRSCVQLAASFQQQQEAGRKKCPECCALEARLESLTSERAKLEEQLNELEELENDSRLMSQKLTQQVGQLGQQLDECRSELKRSCESESKLRFQNKRLHFELRQRQDCVANLQCQMNELRSKVRSLLKLQKQVSGAAPQATATATPEIVNMQPPKCGPSVASQINSYDSAYSKSSSSASSSSSEGCCSSSVTSGAGSSTNSEVDCCESEEPQEKVAELEARATPTSDDGTQLDEKTPRALSSSRDHDGLGLGAREDADGAQQRAQVTAAMQTSGQCLLLTDRQQVHTKRISTARILRGIHKVAASQSQGQVKTSSFVTAASSCNDSEGAASRPLIDGSIDSHEPQASQPVKAPIQSATTGGRQTNRPNQQAEPADSHQDRALAGHLSTSSPSKLNRSFDVAGQQQEKHQQPAVGKSPIELALEGVDELERAGGAGDEALRSLCTDEQQRGRRTSSSVVVVVAKPTNSDDCTPTRSSCESVADGLRGGESAAGDQLANKPTSHLIDGLKQEVSNLRMRLLQANHLNDNLIIELKAQQQLVNRGGKGQPAELGVASAHRRSISLTSGGLESSKISIGQQQRHSWTSRGQSASDVATGAPAASATSNGPALEQPRRSSVIYVNGLSASVTHHHHHYEQLRERQQQQQINEQHQLPVVVAQQQAGSTNHQQPTFCHNCCLLSSATTARREQFHGFAQQQNWPVPNNNANHQHQVQSQTTTPLERELADFLKFLQDKLHFHHGRTFKLVSECQKLAMDALLASYNQQISLHHHQRAVLAGQEAAWRTAAELSMAASRQAVSMTPTLHQSDDWAPSTTQVVRPPPRRRAARMISSQKRTLAGSEIQPADPGAADSTSQRHGDLATTSSALQVAKQTLFSLVPIYYSCNKQQQQQQQQHRPDPDEALRKFSSNNNDAERPDYTIMANNGQSATPTIPSAAAADQSNVELNWTRRQATSVGGDAKMNEEQPKQNGDIYATVNKSTVLARAKGVSILKVSDGSSSSSLTRGGRSQQQPNEHTSSQPRVFETINHNLQQQQQQQRNLSDFSSVRQSLSEEIERLRVHSNGQLLDLLTRQNWCESLITEKLKAIERRQQPRPQQQVLGQSSAGEKSLHVNHQSGGSMEMTRQSDMSGNESAQRQQQAPGNNIHMLDKSTLYCSGGSLRAAHSRLTSLTTTTTAAGESSILIVPHKSTANAYQSGTLPIKRRDDTVQLTSACLQLDRSLTNSFC